MNATDNGFSLNEARRRIESLESRLQDTISRELFAAIQQPLAKEVSEFKESQKEENAKIYKRLNRIMWMMITALGAIVLQMIGMLWQLQSAP